MIETIARQDGERSAVVVRVASIAAALPDSAYLTSLGLDVNGAGEMTGMAPRAATVVSALERRGAVIGPRLIGSAVRDLMGEGELERFAVTFGAGEPR
jgi:hypothetical protein